MLSLAWPWMILLLPLPWIIIHFSDPSKKNSSPTIIFPKLQQISTSFAVGNVNNYKSITWRIVLLSVAWICLVISLMRPELVKNVAYSDNRGYDLMLAVDLSRSMDTVDFSENGHSISRISATKKVVSKFVRQRYGDRVGLIVFAEQAYLTIPLTLDTSTVAKMLNNLMVGMAGESTALGDAIGIGVKNLRKRSEASRVLILLTDGIDNASHIPPLEAAKIASADKIKIYTIGVGDKLDDELLKNISEMTGGTFSKVKNIGAMEEVYKQIDKLEKSDSHQQALLIKTPLYKRFLLIALICVGVFFIIDARQYRYGYASRKF